MNRLDEAHSLLSILLETFSIEQDLDVKWEGQVSDPSSDLYLKEWLLPGESTGLCLGPNSPNAGPLIYQVSVVAPLGGWGEAYAIAKTFFGSNYFYRGRFFTNAAETCRLSIWKGQTGPGFREDTKYILPMSVTLRAYMTI